MLGPRDFDDCVDDVGIGTTTTDVAAHALANFDRSDRHFCIKIVGDVARDVRLDFRQHGNRRTDLARCAVAALEPIMLNEGCLHGMKIVRLTETFDCGDRVAFMHDSKRQAGIDAASVDYDSARTTLAVITSLLGSGEMEMLA